MSAKKKNSVNEPSEVYETTSNTGSTSQELHPILLKLLDKSEQEADEGKLISNKEAMQRIKEKIASLK